MSERGHRYGWCRSFDRPTGSRTYSRYRLGDRPAAVYGIRYIVTALRVGSVDDTVRDGSTDRQSPARSHVAGKLSDLQAAVVMPFDRIRRIQNTGHDKSP